MATKKKSASAKKDSARVIIEVVVRNETASSGTISNNLTPRSINALGIHEWDENTPNFEFKFTVANGTRLSRIDIDGYVFDREKLEKASKIDADGKLVVSVYMPAMTTPIPMIIEAVGEPFRVITFTLKYSKKDVYKEDDPQKITMGENRRGRLEIAEVNLP
jgi:hypothetical protein